MDNKYKHHLLKSIYEIDFVIDDYKYRIERNKPISIISVESLSNIKEKIFEEFPEVAAEYYEKLKKWN